MPTVPGANGPENYAIPDVAPDARMQSLDPTVGTAGMQAIAGLGDQIDKSVDQTNDTLMSLQQMKNQASIADGVNQYQTAANANYAPGGIMTLQGKNAMDAAPQVMKNLDGLRSSIIANAQTPYEKEQLTASLNDQQRSEFRIIGSHVADQTIAYNDASMGALGDTSANMMANNYNQPSVIQTGLATVTHTATIQAQTRGLNGPAANEFILGAQSKAVGGLVDATMVNNPSLAATYLTQYKQYLDAPTYSQLSGRVRQAVMPGAADEVAGAVLGTNASVVPQEIVDQVGQNESGNKPGLTSATGALGQYQIEPGTGEIAAKEIGVPWDPQRALNDPAYGRQLSTRILDDNLKTFAGQPYQYQAAIAAYNAGPNGAGVAHLAQTGDPSQLPAKTQGYLKEFDLSGASPQPGAAGQSVDQQGQNLQALMQQGGQALAARFPDQPNAYEMGSQAVYSQYIRTKSSYDDQQSAALNAVTNAVDANKITNPGDLIKLGGDTAQSWLALDPQKQQGVLTLMSKNVPGADTQPSPAGDQMYYKLLGLSVSDPGTFRSVNLMDPTILNAIPRPQLDSLMSDQKAIANKTPPAISNTDMSSAMSNIAPLLISSGIGTKGGAINPKDPNYQQIAGAMGEQMKSYLAKNGTLPSPLDQQKMASALLVQGTVSGTGGIFFGPKAERVFQARNDDQVDPASGVTYGAEGKGAVDPRFQPTIPEKDMAAINASYQKVYGHPPDIATANALYMRGRGIGS